LKAVKKAALPAGPTYNNLAGTGDHKITLPIYKKGFGDSSVDLETLTCKIACGVMVLDLVLLFMKFDPHPHSLNNERHRASHSHMVQCSNL
jgi:hypothetical protein